MFSGFMGSLPGMMYDQTSAGAGANPVPTDRLWGAALTLIVLIAVLNVGGSVRRQILCPEKGLAGLGALLMAKRLDLKDVNIYYGSFHAVADVSLSVPPRSVTAFIGPSGLRQVDGAAHAEPDARGDSRRPRRGLGAARR